VRWSIVRHPAVDGDIQAIARWLDRYADPENVERRLDEIDHTVLLLSQFPYSGAVRDEVAPDLRAIPTSARGVVTYLVDADRHEILIISITYAGANWMALSRQRVSDPQ